MTPEQLKELVERFQPVAELFMSINGTDEDDLICDMIADLAHWADAKEYSFDNEYARGIRHYGSECMEAKHGTDSD